MFDLDGHFVEQPNREVKGYESSTTPDLCKEAFHNGILCQARSISALNTVRHPMDAQVLAKAWGIGLEMARRTIRVTTQRGIRHQCNPGIERRFPPGDRAL